MDLANMRENGVRSLQVHCLHCGVDRVVNVDSYDGRLTVKSFERRMICLNCGRRGADVRPNWSEVPLRLPRL